MMVVGSAVKRAGPITLRSLDRDKLLLSMVYDPTFAQTLIKLLLFASIFRSLPSLL